MIGFLKPTLVMVLWFIQGGPVYSADKAKARIEACPGGIHTRNTVKGTPLGTTCQLYKTRQTEREGVDS